MERTLTPSDDVRSTPEPSVRAPRLRRFRFPVLFVAVFAVMVAFAAVNQLVAPIPLLALPVGIGLAVAGVLVYRRLTTAVEGRVEVPELARRDMWSGLRRGALLGGGLFTAVMALILVFGGFDTVSWGSVFGALGIAGSMTGVAVMEEALFRGVLFRILEERAGTVVALVVSSVLFGATHLVNGNATVWGTLAIALTGGTMLAAAYVVTRSLWFPIGMHFAWNVVQGGVFGTVVSGSDQAPEGLLHTSLTGPVALTGGGFGPEASLVSLVVCLVAAVVLLRRAVRTGQIRPRP
ncbi:CPBP family intramembrane glutamic endopeptidase [Umezawaea tangerina]|uniref:CAAX prenyl protease 2/Lysostaphin resistance protein A-like domain-containing protein n=1 Tax=Umezawaea tangerina TaxID=84725 RepID=A0A2T0SLV3_9PSEU|nr:type II CAAX endopeptidase family protein [Umezawaea tangerina]PRY34392.1 hypothetical protein CLV43_117166 [Umezawaea tangerina]